MAVVCSAVCGVGMAIAAAYPEGRQLNLVCGLALGVAGEGAIFAAMLNQTRS